MAAVLSATPSPDRGHRDPPLSRPRSARRDRVPRRQRANGRHNLHVLDQAIDLYLSGSAGTRSALEDRFLHLLHLAGIPEPLVNMHLHGEEVDCHWPGRTLVVEVDGPNHRNRPATKQNDARRDAKLAAAGYTVLRFTDVEIERRPEAVLARLLRCL
jgi:hypothetical protein